MKVKVWQAIIEENRSMIQSYLDVKKGFDTAINNMAEQLRIKKEEREALEHERRTIERGLTGVQPTVDEMNGILLSFGFRNFKLETAGDQREQYKIVRLNGTDAALTLSEGEKSFVCFLYFFQLLKVSTDQSGMTEDRIVVIDDPISSLDSEILFIVSSLVKRVILDVCDEKNHLKQIFILTHNVYFHKEVSYDRRRT